jgi:electron transfer flavoprotein beta subunit
MRILICVKRVPMPGGKIILTADQQAIETRHLGFTISPHEECGVEEAIRLVEAHSGESVVLTVGPDEAIEQLRDAMAMGVDRAIHLVTDGQEWDPEATATAILDAVSADEAEHGVFDLVLFGNESADSGGYQIGLRVAHALQRPCATGIKGITISGQDARLEQETTAGRDVYIVPLPAVATVKEGLNLPRYPSVPGRMRANRKPVSATTPTRPAARLERRRLVVPPGQTRQAEVLGRGPDAAAAVVEILRQAGVV